VAGPGIVPLAVIVVNDQCLHREMQVLSLTSSITT
jgi:hypothetical protein